MKNAKFLLLAAIVGIALCAQSQVPENRSDSILKALSYQRMNYPVSQYRDVYKNFLQDFFGPGHLLNDTSASGKYLRYELSSTENFDGPDYEPTGFQGNFYRVNLRLIKDGTIPYDVFFETFVESVQGITPPDSETWMSIWKEIDKEIMESGWAFVNEEKDRKDLADQFEEGNFVVHHSDQYNESVNFHYRIISRDNFEKKILPLINRNLENNQVSKD